MPESTTTNEQKDIATKGTLHVAQATAPDVCKVPSMQMAPMPFPNYVTSTKLTKGATTKSFIASFPVWTSIGELGPPSEPAHIGTGGGVTSGTYRDVAMATSYSKDVFFEGNAAVRLNDTTTQNKANTVGVVVYGPSVGIFAKADDYDFQIALKRVLRYEGGLSDDEGDTGGRTMKGITHSEYDKYRDAHKLPRQDVAKISDAEVADMLAATAGALRLLGARALVTGVSPEVAWTFVERGEALGAMTTVATLKAAVAQVSATTRHKPRA